jgi:hypothetical protein
MKASEVMPLTTVYQQQAAKWETPRRAVVLATGTWAGEDDRGVTGRTPYVALREMATGGWSGLHKGWPVLVASPYSHDISNEMLLALAGPALNTLREGRMPDDLPTGVQVELLGARSIVQPWEDHLGDTQDSLAAQAAAEARQAETDAAEAAARARIAAVVDASTMGTLESLVGYGRVQPWRQVEQVLNTYASARAHATT